MNQYEQRQAILLLIAMEEQLAEAKEILDNARYNVEEFPHKSTMRRRLTDARQQAVDAWNIAKDHIKRHNHLIAIIDDTFPTLHQHKDQLLK